MIEEENQHEMSFLDHLEEFRWHIIRSFIAILVLMIVAFLAKNILFHHILLAPSRADFPTYQLLCKISQSLNTSTFCIDELPFILQSRKMTGQFTMHMLASFVAGLIVAFPYVFWEIWRFVKPALYNNEKKFANGTVFFVTILFFMGVSFGYYVIVPLSVNFLANYTVDPTVMNEFDITNYVSTVTTLTMVTGLVFQFPVLSFFLARAGLVTADFLRKFRKHAIVVIMILSAVITPPDPASQVLIAIPIFLLYQLSIVIAAMVNKKQQKKQDLLDQAEERSLLDEIEE
ncbi:MAG: twin-arginine translocase subunit TatC [Cyclobacteriaceae bacterium]